jgi:arylsulfatase A-like enzyme
LLPTALAAAGVKPQSKWKLDGVNLLPFLTGRKSGPPHDALYWRLGQNMAIRKGDWKLVKTSEGSLQDVDAATFNDLSGAELYNLTVDIGEKNNLAAAHPEKVKELAAAWHRWHRGLLKPLWSPGERSVSAPAHR